MRLLHVADVHLGASLSAFGNAAEARRRAIVGAFRQLPQLATTHRADALLVAGDLFDGPEPGVAARAAAAEVFAELIDSGRPVFAVPGNHDSHHFQPNPYRDDLGGAQILLEASMGEPASAETANGTLHVYGVAYDPAIGADPLEGFVRSSLPGTHVALLHGSIPSAPQWNASPNGFTLLPDALRHLDVDYIALGDHHRYRDAGSFDGLPACYPGSFAAINLAEVGPRGVVLVELDDDAPPRTRLIPSGVEEVVDLGRLDVSDSNSALEIVQKVTEQLPQGGIPLVELVGIPRFPLDEVALTEALIGRFGHARVSDETRFVGSQRLDEIARQDTIAAHVVRLGRRRMEQAADERGRRVADRALRIALREMGVE